MILKRALLTAAGLLLALHPISTQVVAAEPGARYQWWTATYECCCPPMFGNCCDDYCRKPYPNIACAPQCFECDDYCRRPAPCVLRPQLTCEDDYCRKPCPQTCWPATTKVLCVPYCNDTPHVCSEPPQSARRPKTLWIR